MYYTSNNEELTNFARVSGEVIEVPKISHKVEDENFYEFKVAVERLSKIKDIIPITCSEKILQSDLRIGSFVEVQGEYRSYNKLCNEKSRLVLHLFAKSVKELEAKTEDINEVKLTGFICKEPVYRKTPFEREICDVLVAVNRPNNHKSDYVPCIMWGRNARFIASQKIGCKIDLTGRIQSRDYEKTLPNGDVENKTAYEVSCQRIAILSNVTSISKEQDKTDEAVNQA